jgi:uncharacterized protein
MISVDSGFLFALADGTDQWHTRARAWAATLEEGWVTTWPVITETCHLLGRRLAPSFIPPLLDDVAAGVIELWDLPLERVPDIAPLLRKYGQLPMDLADASLVLLAEHLGHGRILSTDMRDFGAYRWKSRKPFHNLLEAAP